VPGVPDRLLRTTCLVVATLVGVFLIATGRADAATDPDLESLIAGSSTCPRPDLVLAELATLLPPDRLGPRLHAVAAAPAVELVDLGAPFQVVVAGHVREYRDDARDCTQRARVAAVFVAMTIDPAAIAAAPPAPPPAPVATIAAPPSLPPPPPAGRLDVAAALDAGVGTADRVAHGGLALRLTVGRERLAFAAGALALWPVDTSIGGVRLRQWRLPIDAGVRLQRGGQRFAPYAELGLLAAVLSETAFQLETSSGRTTIELGARGALGVRMGASRFAPFAALHAELIPSPPEIYALPAGVAGHTPWFWIGASAGASLGFL
jgi:hypothetical protein